MHTYEEKNDIIVVLDFFNKDFGEPLQLAGKGSQGRQRGPGNPLHLRGGEASMQRGNVPVHRGW